MAKKRTSTMPLSERVTKLMAALRREEQSLNRQVSNPGVGTRAKLRFEAQAKMLAAYIPLLDAASIVREEDVQHEVIAVQTSIHEARINSAEVVERMQEELWTTDEETPEEEKAEKDYPQLWIPTAEHVMLQRLQKQISDMLRAHEEKRQ